VLVRLDLDVDRRNFFVLIFGTGSAQLFAHKRDEFSI
jgi:hypothetical protein